MPLISANISMLFTEVPFMQRFALAAQSGFRAVEIQFPYAYSAKDILAQLQEHDLNLVLFNLPAGDWDAGDRGIAANWSRRDEFRAGIETAMEYAEILQPNAINLLAGASEDTDENDLALLQNIRLASEALSEEAIPLVIEPVNTVDVPDFALPRARAALDVIAELDIPNVKLQLDVYHTLMMDEDPIELLQQHIDDIGHIQIADVPGRHQPGTGVVDWNVFFASLTALGYGGAVGLEYIPEGETALSFGTLKDLGVLD